MSEVAAASPEELSAPPGGERFYFPELDGLRFFAFALVFLFHGGIPFPELAGLVGSSATRAFRENGRVGVQLFFVLSGYLITTLLLREEARYGSIDVRAFWVRRILRIWPLYYLSVTISFLLLPWLDGNLRDRGYCESLAIHLPAFGTFLGNWSILLIRPVPFLTQVILWSVCVEEQFYLVVPLFLSATGRRPRILIVIGVMVGSIVARGALARWSANPAMVLYNTFAQLDTLLSGVLLALLLGRSPTRASTRPWTRWLPWPWFAATAWLLTRPELGHGPAWRKTWDFVAIWAWGVAIVALAVTQRGWLPRALAYSRLVWLGKISYGLYMYHMVAIWLRERLSVRLPWFPNKEVLLTIGTFALTVALAATSYYGFERRFLERKRSWTRVASRPV